MGSFHIWLHAISPKATKTAEIQVNWQLWLLDKPGDQNNLLNTMAEAGDERCVPHS
jgi:hypothetical protein